MLIPKRPCPNCPWKVETPPGEFSACRYEALKATAPREDGSHPGIGDPMFACHKSAEGAEYVCAGWLAAIGAHHIGVRINVALGHMPADALRPKPDWPELFTNYEDMARRQAGL